MGRTGDLMQVCAWKKGRRESADGYMLCVAAGAAHSPSRAEQPCIRKNLQTGSMRLHYFLSASSPCLPF